MYFSGLGNDSSLGEWSLTLGSTWWRYMKFPDMALVLFGFWEALRGEHLSTRSRHSSSVSHFFGPIRFPQHLCSVHDHGRQRSGRGPQPLNRPYVGLSVHRAVWAEEYDRPVSKSVATPEPPSKTTPHPRSDAGRPLEPWVGRHTREPTVLSRLSCRPSHLNFDRFHQPCLLPLGALLGEVRTVVPVPRDGHLPLRAARPFLLCVWLEVFATPTRRYHGRMLIHPSSPCVCHLLPGHTQVRDPHEPAAACYGHTLGTPSPWPSVRRFSFKLSELCEPCPRIRQVSRAINVPIYTSNLLEQMYASENAQRSSRSGFWILKISRKIEVFKQSQFALFGSISHMTILFVCTCMMKIWNQSNQTIVTGLGPFCDWLCKFIYWP